MIPGLPAVTYKLEGLTKLKKNNLILTIQKMYPTYRVGFSFKANMFSNGWKNIIHMTVKGLTICFIILFRIFHLIKKSQGLDHFQTMFIMIYKIKEKLCIIVISFIFFNSDDNCALGNRIPGIWAHQSNGDTTARSLRISAAVDQNCDHYFDTSRLTMGIWHLIVLQQILINSKYIYSIQLNGQEVHTKENNNPLTFENVKLYIGDPWYESQDGEVKDLQLELGLSRYFYTWTVVDLP